MGIHEQQFRLRRMTKSFRRSSLSENQLIGHFEATFKGDVLHSKINEQKCHFDGAQRQRNLFPLFINEISHPLKWDSAKGMPSEEMTRIDVVHEEEAQRLRNDR